MRSQLEYVLQFEKNAAGTFHKLAGICGGLCCEERAICFLRFENGDIAGELLQWAEGKKWRASTAATLCVRSKSIQLAEYHIGALTPVFCFGLDGQSVEEIVFEWHVLECLLPEAPTVWELWSDGPPSRLNQWSSLGFHERRAWLDLVCRTRRYRQQIDCREFELDGRYVTNYPAAFLALGEAIKGPGGYFGRNLDSLEDCLRGGFGVMPPFSLKWKDSEVARRHLSAEAWRRELSTTSCYDDVALPDDDLFSVFVELLRTNGVSVELG